MMRALVLYHSLYGNTRRVAESLARGMRFAGLSVDCLSIREVVIGDIPRYDLLAIGSPTHKIRPSEEMRGFLKRLRAVDLSRLGGFGFDTRNDSRLNNRSWFVLENSAARVIEKALRKMRVKIVRPRVSATVRGREGPLYQGVEQQFMELGREIGAALVSHASERTSESVTSSADQRTR